MIPPSRLNMPHTGATGDRREECVIVPTSYVKTSIQPVRPCALRCPLLCLRVGRNMELRAENSYVAWGNFVPSPTQHSSSRCWIAEAASQPWLVTGPVGRTQGVCTHPIAFADLYSFASVLTTSSELSVVHTLVVPRANRERLVCTGLFI